MFLQTITRRVAAAALLGTFALGVGGVGTAAAASALPEKGGARVNVNVQAGTATAQNTFTTTFFVSSTNHTATDFKLTVPFDTSAVKLLNVQVSAPGGWLANVAPDSFETDLGSIWRDAQAVAVNATFENLASMPASQVLTSDIKFSYHDANGSHSTTTEQQIMRAAQPAPAGVAIMQSGGTLNVSAAAFASNELVTFWLNDPTGAVEPLYIRNGRLSRDRHHTEALPDGSTHNVNNGTFLAADGQGAISTILSANLLPGAYTLVGRGNASGQQVVIPFQVQ